MQQYRVTVNNGSIYWHKIGTDLLHREDGPAIESASGNKFWYFEGKLHRVDGPAIEWANGIKLWYIEGKEYTEEEFLKKTSKKQDTCDGKMVEIDGITYMLKRMC